MDIKKHNQAAWDGFVEAGNRWTVPVTADLIAKARRGEWEIVLTPQKPVPRDWFGELPGKQLLCLAGGGGQQGPILAAAGAKVTVFDNSDRQLQQDRDVAARDSLEIRTLQGDMTDLSIFEDTSFDLIVHPCSNGFIPDVNPVWKEAFRILKPGGRLMSGFLNPVFHIFDYWEMEKGKLDVQYRIPYSDIGQLPQSKIDQLIAEGESLEFGHSLEDQLGGQLRAGFRLTGFYEDKWGDGAGDLLSGYINPLAATLAEKPSA